MVVASGLHLWHSEWVTAESRFTQIKDEDKLQGTICRLMWMVKRKMVWHVKEAYRPLVSAIDDLPQ